MVDWATHVAWGLNAACASHRVAAVFSERVSLEEASGKLCSESVRGKLRGLSCLSCGSCAVTFYQTVGYSTEALGLVQLQKGEVAGGGGGCQVPS